MGLLQHNKIIMKKVLQKCVKQEFWEKDISFQIGSSFFGFSFYLHFWEMTRLQKFTGSSIC